MDIWIITQNTKVDWKQIFTDAQSKAVGILPPDIARRLETFPPELLDQIKWMDDKKPSLDAFQQNIHGIILDMLGI